MTYLNVVEIESALVALATAYPTITELITLPYLTAEGRRSHALRIGNGTCPRSAVLIISGAHAREWGGPDICINFAADLLEAWSLNSGLVYGGTSYTAAQIRAITSRLDVIVFPDINPDGRYYSQNVSAMWRKNRNPASSGGQASKVGVDVNRNYDFLWDFTTAFAPGAQAAGTLASTSPSNDLFHGTGPFSEAETRNVRFLFDRYRRISWFVDIHSYGGDILHPWGDDANQTSTPSMNFTNPAWNGQRGLAGDAYAEFIGSYDLAGLQATGNATKAAIAGVRGQAYTVAQSFFLPGWGTYPTSGASDDWAFSRHFSNPSKSKVRSYTIEFNRVWDFFPTFADMQQIILDVDAGLVRFCLDATPSPPFSFLWCWWLHWLDKALWRRLFPWELWGPYGPWSWIPRGINSVVSALTNPIVQFLEAVTGRDRGPR